MTVEGGWFGENNQLEYQATDIDDFELKSIMDAIMEDREVRVWCDCLLDKKLAYLCDRCVS